MRVYYHMNIYWLSCLCLELLWQWHITAVMVINMNGRMIIALPSFFIIMKWLEHVYLSNWLGPLCINLFSTINQFPNQTQNTSLIFSHTQLFHAHDLDKAQIANGKISFYNYAEAMNHLTANFLYRTWLIPYNDWLDKFESQWADWPEEWLQSDREISMIFYKFIKLLSEQIFAWSRYHVTRHNLKFLIKASWILRKTSIKLLRATCFDNETFFLVSNFKVNVKHNHMAIFL